MIHCEIEGQFKEAQIMMTIKDGHNLIKEIFALNPVLF